MLLKMVSTKEINYLLHKTLQNLQKDLILIQVQNFKIFNIRNHKLKI